MRKVGLTYVVTHATTANLLLRGQLAFMTKEGFDVSVICAPGADVERVRDREGVRVETVAMERGVGGASDLAALAGVGAVMRGLHPTVVNASTPKAGLLGMLAARALRVPVRIYTLRGLRLETARGLLRTTLATTERIASSCAHEVVCVSPSVKRAAASYIPSQKTVVLCEGSSNGVDIDRFTVTPALGARARALAHELGVDIDGENVGFVGRYNEDKGLDLLLDAFDLLSRGRPRARLLLVGGDLAGEDVSARLRERIRGARNVIDVGRVEDTAPYYPLMRVLAFPSKREGFPNAPIEAACAEVPTVGVATATGVSDAVIDGVTGKLVVDRDPRTLAAALERYFASDALRKAHGVSARERAARSFSRERVWRAWADEYRRLLAARGAL